MTVSSWIYTWACAFLLGACSFGSDQQAVTERYHCYCGNPAFEPQSCGVWKRSNSTISTPESMLKTVSSEACNSRVCKENFSAFCKSITIWPHPVKNLQADDEPCYCDYVGYARQSDPDWSVPVGSRVLAIFLNTTPAIRVSPQRAALTRSL